MSEEEIFEGSLLRSLGATVRQEVLSLWAERATLIHKLAEEKSKNNSLKKDLKKIEEYLVQACIDWADPHPNRTAETRGTSADKSNQKAYALMEEILVKLT